LTDIVNPCAAPAVRPDSVRMATTAPPSAAEPAPAAESGKIRFRALVRACGGPRYAVAIGVDAIGTGMLRPFLLLYGIDVLRLAPPVAGLAMTVGVVAGLVGTPLMGRWLDRGVRSAAVAAAMFVRVIGTALLLLAPAGTSTTVWVFVLASLVFGVGNQTSSAAHAALVATVSAGRERDAALAASHSLRNAGLGLGALVATAGLAGGTAALRELAIGTAAAYLVATVLTWSVRVRADRQADAAQDAVSGAGAVPRMGRFLAANVIFVFVLSVPEVALPLVLVTVLHASAVWAAAVFVANTVLVVALQVPVTMWMARFSRQTALAVSGVVIAASYLGFLGAVGLGHGWAAPAVAAVSVLSTLGEIIYAGSATALVVAMAPERVVGRALGRLTLSTGFSLAVAPAVITALAAHGGAALWLPLAAATLLSAAVVTR
jgi:MFS family permease